MEEGWGYDSLLQILQASKFCTSDLHIPCLRFKNQLSLEPHHGLLGSFGLHPQDSVQSGEHGSGLEVKRPTMRQEPHQAVKEPWERFCWAFCSSFFCYVQAAIVECFHILRTFFSLYLASLFDKFYWRVKKGARRSRWARPQAEHVGLKPNEFQHKHVMSTELPPKFPIVLGWDRSSHGDIPPQFHLHVTGRYVTDTKENFKKITHTDFRLIFLGAS